jgi:DNA-binding response OmpR family regulator
VVLGNAKHDVETADNGFNGLQCVRAKVPDLILLDIVMNYGGLPTLRVLREQFPGVRVIMMSGSERARLAIAGGLGAARTLAKPFTSEQLLAAVNEVLSS